MPCVSLRHAASLSLSDSWTKAALFETKHQNVQEAPDFTWLSPLSSPVAHQSENKEGTPLWFHGKLKHGLSLWEDVWKIAVFLFFWAGFVRWTVDRETYQECD